ncbi:MAG: hypothetical protein ACF8K1_13855 [Phycisphaerales bacterium JB047]
MQLFMFFFEDNGTPKPLNTGDAHSNKPIKSTRSRRCPLPPHHKNAPIGTSETAAARIAPHTPNQRSRVYAAIQSAGAWGLTDEEGEALTGIKTQSYTPRRGELVQNGMIQDTGKRRRTASGCPAAVWVAVSKRGDSADA